MRCALMVCWIGTSVLDDVGRDEVRASDPGHDHHYHQACRWSNLSFLEDGFQRIDGLSCKALLSNIMKMSPTFLLNFQM